MFARKTQVLPIRNSSAVMYESVLHEAARVVPQSAVIKFFLHKLMSIVFAGSQCMSAANAATRRNNHFD
jgi:hypothetical protein